MVKRANPWASDEPTLDSHLQCTVAPCLRLVHDHTDPQNSEYEHMHHGAGDSKHGRRRLRDTVFGCGVRRRHARSSECGTRVSQPCRRSTHQRT